MFRKWKGNPWAILTALCLGFFMTLLDLTIVNVAIPDITDDLDTSLDVMLWILNAYTLALATLIITAGRLGDLRGKGNLFLVGVAVFTAASLACGLAQNVGELIAFRAVQGAGAAMLIPQTLSIIAEVFPKEQRGKALGIWGTVAGVSGAAGPGLGGVMVTHLDWRWVFYINVPIGLFVLVRGASVMPKAGRSVRHRFDLPGVLLASVGLFGLTYALTEGERYDWNGWIWGAVAASVALLAVFLGYERGRQDAEPLLPFTLFRDRNFSVVNFVGVAVSFGVIAILLPTTIYLQSVLGYSAQKTGLVLIPLALGSMVTAGPAGVLSEKFGGKYVLTAGLTMFGAGVTWILFAADPEGSWGPIAGAQFLAGLGAGCTFAPMGSEVVRNVPGRLVGAASGVNNALRQVGSVLAATIVGAVLQGQLVSALRDQAAKHASALPEEYRAGFVRGFAKAGEQGLNVGTEQTTQVPAGVPEDTARTVGELSAKVFGNGFVDALQPTLWVSAAVLFVGALTCLLLKGGPAPAGSAHGLPVGEEETPRGAAVHG
ncbi:MFS transporter [Streptomyces sp. I05A-00742]|uniref:MFS transporter n=1 Tax=Streptomyces sp. I05A-00742 TaxID=2732853 RepID=UPI001487A177|nr:MFS transporter [Streptomyces sp. I05A-00742]